ncbi:MAG: type IV pili twitching motility protein PilT, partial [Woeseiaceae bacterium]
TQNLVKTPDGRGRRAVLEIMVMTRAISKMIATDQTHQIPAQLQTGRDLGMQTMDSALMEAINKKQVDPDDAYRFASDKHMFQKYVTDTSILPSIEVAD